MGAGPGDPGLITYKGLQLLRRAEVVVFDRLVGRLLLDEAPAGAEMMDVGKMRGSRRQEQGEINRTLVDRAREGKMVVRLKGGDPFVFGRGGEEAETLAEEGIPFEVVPGITSAIAAPAYAGIPVTHRGVSTSVTVVTGSEDPTKGQSTINWQSLATTSGTLVVLMGWETLPGIIETLKGYGMSPSTPVALIQWGTHPYQRTVVGTMDDIVERGREASLTPPVIAVFGPVVDLRKRINWFDSRPLFGKRVLVPRTRAQASVLSRLLLEQGAEPVEVPTIKAEAIGDDARLDPVLGSLSRYAWVVFTSVNGVWAVFRGMEELGLDARAFGGAKVCAIGPATAAALKERGIAADFTPREYVLEGIVEGMLERGAKGAPVLLLRAEAGREALSEGLVQGGAEVEEVPVYRTVLPEESRETAQRVLGDRSIDAVGFTSSSTVRNLVTLLDGDIAPLKRTAVACIGPITAETAREIGLTVDAEAREYTIPGLVEALTVHFSKSRGE